MKVLLFIIFVLVVVNLPLFDFFLQEDYTYANADGSFIYNEESGEGKSYPGCRTAYGYFLCQHPDMESKDKQLYRTFTIKPRRVWEWRELIFQSDRFLLPYKENK